MSEPMSDERLEEIRAYAAWAREQASVPEMYGEHPLRSELRAFADAVDEIDRLRGQLYQEVLRLRAEARSPLLGCHGQCGVHCP